MTYMNLLQTKMYDLQYSLHEVMVISSLCASEQACDVNGETITAVSGGDW
jgi:hypothetical protein